MISQELMMMGAQAKEAARILRHLTSQEIKQALEAMASSLEEAMDTILISNQEDISHAREDGVASVMLERLKLDDKRFEGMVKGMRKIANLPDPLAVSGKQWINDDGLLITQKPIPLGVIGMIYESRPNVTADASALCLKARNAVILRGGKEAIRSNQAIAEALQAGLEAVGLPTTCIQLISEVDREWVNQLMRLNKYVDCLIPRGGAGLIRNVIENATVPVIETGVGNVHLYLHESADYEMARSILLNAKTQRPSVCNAVETLLVDQAFAQKHLSDLANTLYEANVQILGDEKTRQLVPFATHASDEDYLTEFLDLVLAVKVVENYDQAIDHIRHYSSGHSEAIITQDYAVAQSFLDEVDSAAVYVNASTRFTDGEVFGFGGEIGISTQKLHARGPMGLEALTTYKYVIEGKGQIRS